jgi:nucleoside-diphosphate-sugar epimerase
VPVLLMYLAGKLSGKSGTVNRLAGSLAVDGSKVRRELGWKPPFTMGDGLAETSKWFKRQF